MENKYKKLRKSINNIHEKGNKNNIKIFLISLINKIILSNLNVFNYLKKSYKKFSLINTIEKKNSEKSIAFKIQNNARFLSFILVFFRLINIILAENSNNQENNSRNIVYLKVKDLIGRHKIINLNYISNCIAYYNGVKIDFDGSIFIENNKINNVTLMWKNKLDTCEGLFKDIVSIVEIDFSKFDSSEVESMGEIFSGCINLQYINFSNIDTGSVTNMNYMFKNCSSLLSLDLSNFDTSNVKEMEGMFYACISITSLDLSYFNILILKIWLQYLKNVIH